MFAEPAVVGTKGGEEVGIDVELAHDLAVDEDRDHDLGFGFQGAGQVARIGVDVVNNDGLSSRSRSAANALIERDARMRSHGTLERSEDENVTIGFFLEHVKAYPVVAC